MDFPPGPALNRIGMLSGTLGQKALFLLLVAIYVVAVGLSVQDKRVRIGQPDVGWVADIGGTISPSRPDASKIGLRGGGKSTLGMLLAEQLGVPFVELNREIERRAGASLGEIFDMFGQEAFRRAEREALDDVLNQHEAFVLATSGSIVTEPGTLDMLLSSCFTVWVRAEPQEHMKRVMAQGDMRPMANSARAMDDLISILKSREPLYARAEATVTTTGKTPEQNLGELLRVIAPALRNKEPAPAGSA